MRNILTFKFLRQLLLTAYGHGECAVLRNDEWSLRNLATNPVTATTRVLARWELMEAGPELLHAVAMGVCTNSKIKSIKAYRRLTGDGLKEAKEAIDALTECGIEKFDSQPVEFRVHTVRRCSTGFMVTIEEITSGATIEVHRDVAPSMDAKVTLTIE